jgi:hypothetical protein
MLHFHECAEPTPDEFAAEPLHFVGGSTAVKESVVEPLHSVDNPPAAEFAA